MLEYWKVGKNQKKSLSIIPSLPYSTTPMVHLAPCAVVVKPGLKKRYTKLLP
jgi:hypothetical protein